MNTREIDLLIAEKVFAGVIIRERRPNGNTYVRFNDGHRQDIPFYSSDIADAWQVIEKMQDRYQLGLMPTSFGSWVCRGYLPETAKIQVHEETAPLAICLAALKAVGVTYEPTKGERV